LNTRLVSQDNAEHYTWGSACDGWHLLKSESLSVIHERMPGGTSEVRHYHERAQQFFFVLKGELTMELDGTEHIVRSHQGLSIPPHAPHCAINRSGGDTEFLVISQPKSHGDRVEARSTK
jgi:mannose-6-phosphate isomerase-like protein (cupin superfamily)